MAEEVIGVGPKTYVISVDRREAMAWVARNKPGTMAKVCHPDSETFMRGLRLPDDTPVYCLQPPNQRVRELWAATGARLVFLC